MPDKFATYQQHLDYFLANSIDVTHSGFYDQENFISLERANPELLENYASFVDQKPLDNEYLTRAEKMITIIASILCRELKKDGRKGACIDASMGLSRMLEKEGVWNYQAKGSLTIKFPVETGLPPKYFWSYPQESFVAGHSWIVAPPFKIVDITVRLQPYKQGGKKYLPDTILQRETVPSSLEAIDLVETNLLMALYHQVGKDKAGIMDLFPHSLISFAGRFLPQAFARQGVNFKYTPIGIIATDAPFENTVSLRLNGLYGIDIYNRIIKPQLDR